MSPASPSAAAAASTRMPLVPAASGYLSFRLGAEEYGIDILRVQEIRNREAPTRIAGAPPWIQGVVNLRGVIVPIVDLRQRFGVPAQDDASTVSIILNVGQRVVGVVVDAVRDVVELAPDQLRTPPQMHSAADAACIDALGALPAADGSERLLILIDIERLLTSHELGLFTLAGGTPH
jgi:purine-binding chemotaxis protein CheW